jgi:hypothetical protein
MMEPKPPNDSLSSTDDRLYRVFDALDVPAFLYDHNGRMVHANRAARAENHPCFPETVGRSPDDLPHPQQSFASGRDLRAILETGRKREKTVSHSGCAWRVRLLPLINEQKREPGAVLVLVSPLDSNPVPSPDGEPAGDCISFCPSAVLERRKSTFMHISQGLEQLSQVLSSLKFQVEGAEMHLASGDSKRARTLLEGVVSTTRELVDDVQVLSSEVYPSQLDELGLLPALRWLLRRFNLLNPEVRLASQLDAGTEEPPDRLKWAVFRVLQELLDSSAGQISLQSLAVRLKHHAGGVELLLREKSSPEPSAGSNGEHARKAAAPANSEPERSLCALAAAADCARLSNAAFSVRHERPNTRVISVSWTVPDRED